MGAGGAIGWWLREGGAEGHAPTEVANHGERRGQQRAGRERAVHVAQCGAALRLVRECSGRAQPGGTPCTPALFPFSRRAGALAAQPSPLLAGLSFPVHSAASK